MPCTALPDETPLFDSAALRAVEQRAAQATGDAFELMRRAGRAAWRELLEHWPKARRLLIVCGPGNNGGDGYVLATHAQQSGRDVRVIASTDTPPISVLARDACRAYVAAGGRVGPFDGALPEADLVVDALFGIGLSRVPEGPSAALIDAMNAHDAPVFALDVPSGVDAERGSAPAAAVRAACTLELIASKAGLRTGAALDCTGALGLATLDTEPFLEGLLPVGTTLDARSLVRWLQPRSRDSHKGRHGRVLCVGGERGGGGAIMLCAEAALRTGAGLVDVATRGAHIAALLARTPEAMAHACDDVGALRPSVDAADCIAIGPGLGQGEWGRALLDCALDAARPLVLDADALNLLVARPTPLPPDAIITPHPGEAARLLGTDTIGVQRDRIAAARSLVHRFGCVVVLKGAGTIVVAPDARLHVIAAGNPGLAVGGTGDVLTGVIAALRAQGLDAFDAAACGALLHAVAGDSAAADGQRGLRASDLMPWLRRHSNPELAP
ncbi:NAD(P)H-hydrate dehydratase [Cognatilysobacter bugurensis]|uniref:Bifunctional NAD(P)H-hydrate repair enzyme n=1 Tax=Cognatilysobacter bugurensis TaxID=543356 RepID=A0A918SZ44_9GAMM|nr:NAD(P)H-hydrate dehydratase [Lysobacter bugurensis]GHA74502.1 bifunctional NAD(P)H-hydrate repair enzyme [Lysobacter bugurensis]